MSILDTLIINRVPGATYDWRDMNRVAEAMEYVAARLRSCGWNIEVKPRRFTRVDFPTAAVFEHYLKQLHKLHETLTLFLTTPAVPGVGRAKPHMTVQEANDIEKILLDIEDMVRRTEAAYYYSGDVFAGEV